MIGVILAAVVIVIALGIELEEVVDVLIDRLLILHRFGIEENRKVLSAELSHHRVAVLAQEGKNGLAGVYSHMSVKERACLFARTMFTTEGYGFELPDNELINEMGFFVKKENIK